MRAALAGAGAALLLGALAGCGGGGGGGTAAPGGAMGPGRMPHGGMMGRGTTPAAPTAPSASGSGRSIFLASGCGGCHVLADAATSGTAGPSLDEARPGYRLAVDRITNGGGGMPSFAGTLTAAQIRAVARYVADAAG